MCVRAYVSVVLVLTASLSIGCVYGGIKRVIGEVFIAADGFNHW
mgnify:CR=1 FL=1